MKIAIVNTYNVKDVKMWSGISYHIALMLESLVGKDNVDCFEINLKRNVLSYTRGFIFNKVLKTSYLAWADQNVINNSMPEFAKVRNTDYDLILTFQSFVVPLIANKKSKIVFWSDATFKNLMNFYSYVSNLSDFSIKNGNLIQRKSLHLCDAVILSSKWAIDSAVNDYGADPEKMHMIPFAANLNKLPNEEEVNEIISNRIGYVVKLLFLGVNWERKGGDEAVAVVEKLNKAGVKARLYIVGTETPDQYKENKYLINLGYIDKGSEDGENQIIKLLKDSSFLILPTVADCTPVVFCEANSYGLPVITTNVGGIPSVISNGVNGYFFNRETFIDDAVEIILKTDTSTSAYKKLCGSSYNYYHEGFSWGVLEEKFKMILNELF